MPNTPNFRALCDELVEELEDWIFCDNKDEVDVRALIDRARTALATPPPTDEERLADFAQWLAREMPPNTTIGDPLWWAPRIWRAVLRRWGK